MRPVRIVLLLTLFVAASASAQSTIVSVTPDNFNVGSGAHTMRITLSVWDRTMQAVAHFSGPAGNFQVMPSASTTDFYLDFAVPGQIINTIGEHHVQLALTWPGGQTGWTQARPFYVLDNGRSLELRLPGDITLEALGAAGRVVTYQASAVYRDGSQASVSCTPPSGSTFPLGTTVVTCTASDGGGSQSGTFRVNIIDTTPPALALPGNISATAPDTSGVVVTFNATASDVVDGPRPVTCAPASGAKFPIGTTAVQCSAADTRGNTANGAFNVTVTLAAGTPALNVPDDMSVEATGPSGAAVSFTVSGQMSGDDHNGRPLSGITCNPPSGSTFPLGTTVVQCSGYDAPTNQYAYGSFRITVVDTLPPVLDIPSSLSVTATSDAGAIVTWPASATDLVDGSVAITCNPPSGSTFAIGTTGVNCSAGDSRGNSANGGFAVTVNPRGALPQLRLPADMTVEATGPGGAIVTFDARTSEDDANGRPNGTATCTPPSGSLFPLGETTVQCTAPGSAPGSFRITVVDTTAPALALPGDIHTTTTVGSGATVTYSAGANDAVSGNIAVTCNPPSGSTFAVGTTIVHCSAADAAGNTANGSFNVVVTFNDPGDTQAPVIVSITATPDTLQPPNHKMVDVTITVEATDDTDPAPYSRVFAVTVNETSDGSDWLFTGDLTLQLRATRSGQSQERIYRVFVETFDASGNRTVGSVTVHVPHDNSGATTPPQPSSGKRRATRR